MIQRVKVPVSVAFVFNHHRRQTIPTKIQWEGKIYLIEKIGLHHTYRTGRTLHHVFSVANQNLFFKLNLDTDNLTWTLEEISDGLPN